MNPLRIRKDFPILARKIKGKQLIYLDNAATTQKPVQVIDALTHFYSEYNANVHRGVHTLSEEATRAYDDAHENVARFINAHFEEIIFTQGTTESLNALTHMLRPLVKQGDEILLTQMEHHSNMVPWQQLAKEKKVRIRYAPLTQEGKLDMDAFTSLVTQKTKMVSATHVSNVLGTINMVRQMGKIAHECGALFVVDGAQSVPHLPVDVKRLGCDFLAFSGHKMLAPTGTGVLYGRKDLLENVPPFRFGGSMIREVTFKGATWNSLPWKFEAGTPNIGGGIGLGVAVDYLNRLGMDEIHEYEQALVKHAYKVFGRINGCVLHGPKQGRNAVFSFNIGTLHPHDIASLLDDYGIAARGGHHCAMPLMGVLGINGSVRASPYIYNTKDELTQLGEALEKIEALFR